MWSEKKSGKKIVEINKKEFYCPSCKKFVEDVRSEFGLRVAGPSFNFPGGELPVFVCNNCESPVMEMTRTGGNWVKVIKVGKKRND